MSANEAEVFVQDYLAHAYDPAKAHAYYLRTRKLKGRQKGQGDSDFDKSPDKTRRARAEAIGNNAADALGPQRAAAVQRLADKAKADLANLTQEFRDWVESHPRVTDRERFAKRREMLDRKDDIIRKLKSDVAKISSAASSTTKKPAATEGRHH